jgi:predicted nucleic acid-binding protein
MAYEFVNVLRYKDYLNSDHIEEIVQSLFDMQLEWRFPLDQEMLRSVEIARTHGISIYDAVYVTLAEALGAVLVTADEKLARRLTALPFVHFLGDFAKP